MDKNNIWLLLGAGLVIGLLLGYLLGPSVSPTTEKSFESKSIEEQREEWINEANLIRVNLAKKGKYNCCLEKPCWYCIQKTPGHGEGAECQCLKDIQNGEHPCGECIGEILEGNGLKDKEIVKFYAKAIADKVGEQHTDHLKEIISDMYGISIEEQM